MTASATTVVRGDADAGSVGVISGAGSGLSTFTLGCRGRDTDRRRESREVLATELRLPVVRIPSAPTLEGPRIVVVYLRPVAPGNPDGLPPDSSSLGAGLDGIASSGHRSTSASPASTTYGLARYDGSNEMSLGPYGSSTLRRYCKRMLCVRKLECHRDVRCSRRDMQAQIRVLWVANQGHIFVQAASVRREK